MNPFNIRQPQDRRKVYNEYLANLQMQIDNLAKTENAVATVVKTGVPPIQPTDTRTLSEKLLDIDKQKQVLRQALLDITDGAEASKIMNTIADEDVVFLGVAWSDFSKMIKQKFASGILAPLFNEVLQRYKRDYINSISVQKGMSTGHATEELLLTMRELIRLIPSPAQLRDLRFTITNVPSGTVPERMRATALEQIDTLGSLIPTDRTIQDLERMNPIDRAAAERAYNDGLSSITTGTVLQDLTSQLQQARGKDATNILNTIIKDIVLTRDDRLQLEKAEAIATQKEGEYEAQRQASAGKEVSQIRKETASARLSEEISPTPRKITKAEMAVKEKAAELKARREAGEFGIESIGEPKKAEPELGLSAQQQYDTELIENPNTPDTTLVKLSLATLRGWVNTKIKQGLIPKTKYVAKLQKGDLLVIRNNFISEKYPVSPPPKARKSSKAVPKVEKEEPPIAPFIEPEYTPQMTVAKFNKFSTYDKRTILGDMLQQKIPQDVLAEDLLNSFIRIYDRNTPERDEAVYIAMFKKIREELGMGGKGLPKKGKRITFGCGLIQKPQMTVKPSNIDYEMGIKREASYIPIGKYVVNKHKLRDNVLLMRTVKGGQIAELPQMTISPKLGKMLNKIIHGNGFPSHDELSELEDSDKDIMFKVFKMSKAEGIESIPRPNKTKDEAEFNRFTILKGQILAGNNSKELIKEFKTLLVKLMHSNKILRKDGHDILIDLAALGY